MHILSVAFPFAPAGMDAVGGAEQVLAAIDRALTQAGHRSTVIAHPASRVRGRLMALPCFPASALVPGPARDAAHQCVREAIASVTDADLIHLHGIDFSDCLPAPGAPVLCTLHLPIDWYPPDALRPARPRTFLHGVSLSQQEAARDHAALLPPIDNGVDVTGLAARHARRRFALMLGRICPEKGQHLALQAAHLARVPLLIAGQAFAYPDHQAYLRDQVAPLLDAARRLIGPADFARKRRLLSAARCVLIPSQAAETSSLVAMETLACGTPVIAWRSGALPGIVRDGVTGFVVDDVAGMTDAIGHVDAIDRTTCRREARVRFDVRRMTDAYLQRYREIIAACA